MLRPSGMPVIFPHSRAEELWGCGMIPVLQQPWITPSPTDSAAAAAAGEEGAQGHPRAQEPHFQLLPGNRVWGEPQDRDCLEQVIPACPCPLHP